MKLYRRHSQEFQTKISASSDFLSDDGRKYNYCEEKNAAKLFFYSTSIEGASIYARYSEFEDTDAPLFEYNFEGRLLDLRKIEDRAKCENLISFLLEEEKNHFRKMGNTYLTEKEKAKTKSEKSRFEIFHKEAVAEAANITSEDVIKDRHSDGLSFWGQRASDYQAGINLKKDLINLGYDGAIFTEEHSTAIPEVALLKKAKKYDDR